MNAQLRTLIKKYLKDQGFTPVDDSFYKRIDSWDLWYSGYVKTFHSYQVYNGIDHTTQERARLNMAKRGCERWANLLWNDECAVSIEGDSKRLNAILTANDFTRQTQILIEKSFAKGTGAYVAYQDAALGARVDYLAADAVFPFEWYNDDVRSCAFASVTVNADGTQTVYLMIHVRQTNGSYRIYNRFFRLGDGTAAGWELMPTPEGILEEFPSDVCRFAIVRPNLVNNVAPVPMGISVYADCIDSIKACDLAFDGYMVSLAIGRPRVAVTGDVVKIIQLADGTTRRVPVFDTNDVALYSFDQPEGADGKNAGRMIQDLSVDFRADKFAAEIQTALTIYSQQIGLGEKAFKWDQGSVATATQVIAENSEMLRTMEKHQQGIRFALETVVRAICNIVGIQTTGKVTIEFDDSAVRDRDGERLRAWQWVTLGKMAFWRYLVDFEDYSEEDAKKIEAEARAGQMAAQELFPTEPKPKDTPPKEPAPKDTDPTKPGANEPPPPTT
jgi:A118 family predicted phage portal protein